MTPSQFDSLSSADLENVTGGANNPWCGTPAGWWVPECYQGIQGPWSGWSINQNINSPGAKIDQAAKPRKR